MLSDSEYLLEMGFPSDLVEKALKATENRGMEAAMEWIMAHQSAEESGNAEGQDDKNGVTEPEQESKDTAIPEARSYICEDCKKVLLNDEAVQTHSSRTGHINYSESSEEVKPLTEEERKAQMEKLQDLLKLKKNQRTEQEKQEELEKERRRRDQGKTITSAKAKFADDEMHRFVEERRREKAEEKAYRENLKATIAREREEKKALERGENPETRALADSTSPKISPSSASATPNLNCRLQIRLPSGPPLKGDFQPSDKLRTVVEYIASNWSESIHSDTIHLFTNFPKRDYAHGDFDKSLSELGLCPSAVLTAVRRP